MTLWTFSQIQFRKIIRWCPQITCSSSSTICITLMFLFVHVCVSLLQVAMQRAKVCVRLVSMSGKSHMRLVKGKDAQPEIADHEAAYRDNTGEDACVHSAQPTRRASGWQHEAPGCWLRLVLPSALINSRHMCEEKSCLLLSEEKTSGAFCLETLVHTYSFNYGLQK